MKENQSRLRETRNLGDASGSSDVEVALIEESDGSVTFWNFQMRAEMAVVALTAAGLVGYAEWTWARRRRGSGASRKETFEEKGKSIGDNPLEQLSFAHATNEEAELSKKKATREISRKMAARERGLQNRR